MKSQDVEAGKTPSAVSQGEGVSVPRWPGPTREACGEEGRTGRGPTVEAGLPCATSGPSASAQHIPVRWWYPQFTKQNLGPGKSSEESR